MGETGRWSRARTPVLAGAAVGVATLVVHVVDPNRPGSYGMCPLRMLTGWLCPLCGGLRAVHALTHVQWDVAWGLNPLVVTLLPLAVLAWAWWTAAAWRGAAPRLAASTRAAVPCAVILGMVLFGVLRNLPVLQPHLAALT